MLPFKEPEPMGKDLSSPEDNHPLRLFLISSRITVCLKSMLYEIKLAIKVLGE